MAGQLEQTSKPISSLTILVHRPNEIASSMTEETWNVVWTRSATRSRPATMTTITGTNSFTYLNVDWTATYTSITQQVEVTVFADFETSETFGILTTGMTQQRNDKTPVDSADSFDKERGAFLQMKETLLADSSYRDKYVAILNSSVVDSDEDEIKLLKRVYGRFGYLPVYVEKVQDKTRIAEISTPEIRSK